MNKYLQRESSVFTYYHAKGYIEQINEMKYLIFDSIDENKELLKKYNDAFNESIELMWYFPLLVF